MAKLFLRETICLLYFSRRTKTRTDRFSSLCCKAELSGHSFPLVVSLLGLGGDFSPVSICKGPVLRYQHGGALDFCCWHLSPEHFQLHILFITLFLAYHHYFLLLGDFPRLSF